MLFDDTIMSAGSKSMLPSVPSGAYALKVPPFRLRLFKALTSMEPPLPPYIPPFASTFPASIYVLPPDRTLISPPEELSPMPFAVIFEPLTKKVPLSEFNVTEPAFTLDPDASAFIAPEFMAVPPIFSSSTVPFCSTTALASTAPSMFTTPLIMLSKSDSGIRTFPSVP